MSYLIEERGTKLGAKGRYGRSRDSVCHLTPPCAKHCLPPKIIEFVNECRFVQFQCRSGFYLERQSTPETTPTASLFFLLCGNEDNKTNKSGHYGGKITLDWMIPVEFQSGIAHIQS